MNFQDLNQNPDPLLATFENIAPPSPCEVGCDKTWSASHEDLKMKLLQEIASDLQRFSKEDLLDLIDLLTSLKLLPCREWSA